MTIHQIQLIPELIQQLARVDCWAVNCTDVQNIAARIVGDFPVPLLRQKNMRAIAGGKTFCSDARFLEEEFCGLADECAQLRREEPYSDVFTAAFFHLRFENIHPLMDCNGRLGRLLLAEQLRRGYGLALESTLTTLRVELAAYRASFRARELQEQFDLLSQLIAKTAGVKLGGTKVLPYPVTPRFPVQNTRVMVAARLAKTGAGTKFEKRQVAVALGAMLPSSRQRP